MKLYHKTYKTEFDHNPKWEIGSERWVTKLTGPFKIRKLLRSYHNPTTHKNVEHVIEKYVFIGRMK